MVSQRTLMSQMQQQMQQVLDAQAKLGQQILDALGVQRLNVADRHGIQEHKTASIDASEKVKGDEVFIDERCFKEKL